MANLQIAGPATTALEDIANLPAEISKFPLSVPVKNFTTLAKVGLDRNRLAMDQHYLEECFSDFGPPLHDRNVMIAPNAGPYSEHLHLLLFFIGKNAKSENLPPQALTDISLEELSSIEEVVNKTIATLRKLSGESNAIILINSGDSEGGVRSQSIPRVHIHVFVPCRINDTDFKDPHDYKSHPDWLYIVDALGISPRMQAINQYLEDKLRVSGVVVEEISRTLQFKIQEFNVINQLYQISNECETLRLALKKLDIHYGFTIIVYYDDCKPKYGRAGFFRDYGELIFGQLIFRTHSDDSYKNHALSQIIRERFEQFKVSYHS